MFIFQLHAFSTLMIQLMQVIKYNCMRINNTNYVIKCNYYACILHQTKKSNRTKDLVKIFIILNKEKSNKIYVSIKLK